MRTTKPHQVLSRLARDVGSFFAKNIEVWSRGKYLLVASHRRAAIALLVTEPPLLAFGMPSSGQSRTRSRSAA